MIRFLAVVFVSSVFLFNNAALLAQESGDLEKEMSSLRKEVAELKQKMETVGDEDFSFLHPGFDKLKISGEIRLREEYKRHLYFPDPGGANPENPAGDKRFDYLHMRTRLRFDLEVMENIDAIIELQDVRTMGESTVNDNEGVDIKRSEIVLTDLLAKNLSMEAGRFVLAYGDQRLIGHLEWWDQGRTYDGVRISYEPSDWYVDFFGFRTNDLATSDDNDQDMVGIYAGKEIAPLFNAEGYVLLYRDQIRDTVTPTPLNVTEKRFVTVGMRAFGDDMGFDYSGEVALQRGDVGGTDDDLKAWAFAVKGGYTLDEVACKPRLGVEVDYATGDHRPGDGDCEQFQHLFPTNHGHYGYADLMGWSNMWDFRSGISIEPASNVSASLDFHHLLLADADGGWINAGGGMIRAGTENDSRHIGEELDLSIKWNPLKPLSFLTGWSHFFPGGFVDDTGRSRQADFFYLQTRLVF